MTMKMEEYDRVDNFVGVGYAKKIIKWSNMIDKMTGVAFFF